MKLLLRLSESSDLQSLQAPNGLKLKRLQSGLLTRDGGGGPAPEHQSVILLVYQPQLGLVLKPCLWTREVLMGCSPDVPLDAPAVETNL